MPRKEYTKQLKRRGLKLVAAFPISIETYEYLEALAKSEDRKLTNYLIRLLEKHISENQLKS